MKSDLLIKKRKLLLELRQVNHLIKYGEDSFTLEEIREKVEKFTGVDVTVNNSSVKDDVEAREIFYRYCSESGYGFSELATFTNFTRAGALLSVKRCRSSKHKNEYYNKFLKLMENAKKEKTNSKEVKSY